MCQKWKFLDTPNPRHPTFTKLHVHSCYCGVKFALWGTGSWEFKCMVFYSIHVITALSVIFFVLQEKPKLKRRDSSRKSSLRNSIRRHNSKNRKSHEDSVIVNDSDAVDSGGYLSVSPHPNDGNSGI